jgi:DNA-binding transcriptional MerR regulator/methylmalonyl-CoA mutase cobalamin-binding subunit
VYTIKQASIRSGVGIPLLRAWERRYGVVAPVRTPAGYRLYDDVAIERLRAMRHLVAAGWSPREAAPQVLAAQPQQLRDLQRVPDPDSGDGPRAAERGRLTAEIVRAAGGMRQDELEATLDATFAAQRFEAAMQGVVFPALAEIGSAWARGELDVAAEHAASAAVLRRLGSAFLAAGGNDGPAVVVGLPPQAHHELAALAFATAARRAGISVVYLGPDVPVDSWLAAVRDTSARAVAVGAVMQRDADSAAAVFAALARTEPAILRLAGGRHADSIAGNGHVVLPEGLNEAVARLREALRAA